MFRQEAHDAIYSRIPLFRQIYAEPFSADLRVTPLTSGQAAPHELVARVVGGQELSGLFGDPVTDRAPIIRCRSEEHI